MIKRKLKIIYVCEVLRLWKYNFSRNRKAKNPKQVKIGDQDKDNVNKIMSIINMVIARCSSFVWITMKILANYFSQRGNRQPTFFSSYQTWITIRKFMSFDFYFSETPIYLQLL